MAKKNSLYFFFIIFLICALGQMSSCAPVTYTIKVGDVFLCTNVAYGADNALEVVEMAAADGYCALGIEIVFNSDWNMNYLFSLETESGKYADWWMYAINNVLDCGTSAQNAKVQPGDSILWAFSEFGADDCNTADKGKLHLWWEGDVMMRKYLQ